MSDRTWNGIDARLWDEDWSLCAMVTMAILISKCPNPDGIYKLPLGAIKRIMADKWPAEDVQSAIDFLAADGAIQLFRDDTIVWLVNKFDRDGRRHCHPNNKLHMMGLNAFLSLFHEVRIPFLKRYNDYKIGIESLSDGDTKPMLTSDPDPDPDPDPESDKNNIIAKRTIKCFKAALADHDLDELEKQCGWRGAWIIYKQASTAATPHQKRSHAALETDLRDLLAKQQKYGLDNAAMAHGVDEAVRKDIYNRNYIITVAQNYNPLKGLSNSAYYGEEKEPLPPMKPGADDIVLEVE